MSPRAALPNRGGSGSATRGLLLGESPPAPVWLAEREEENFEHVAA
jgi:hypothetical protein